MARGLAGDAAATAHKAHGLIALAVVELGDPEKFPAGARARLRQIAHKGWLGITTAADAYLCATEGRSAEKTKQVEGVFKALGSRAHGQYGIAYEVLHTGCGYRDSRGCSPAAVRIALREASLAVRDVERKLARARARGKAKKACLPEP